MKTTWCYELGFSNIAIYCYFFAGPVPFSYQNKAGCLQRTRCQRGSTPWKELTGRRDFEENVLEEKETGESVNSEAEKKSATQPSLEGKHSSEVGNIGNRAGMCCMTKLTYKYKNNPKMGLSAEDTPTSSALPVQNSQVKKLMKLNQVQDFSPRKTPRLSLPPKHLCPLRAEKSEATLLFVPPTTSHTSSCPSAPWLAQGEKKEAFDRLAGAESVQHLCLSAPTAREPATGWTRCDNIHHK